MWQRPALPMCEMPRPMTHQVRPSDALCLASIMSAAIRVDERVLSNPATPRTYPTARSDMAEEIRQGLEGRIQGSEHPSDPGTSDD